MNFTITQLDFYKLKYQDKYYNICAINEQIIKQKQILFLTKYFLIY